MEKKRIELLSPAGTWESLVAAIEGGCDAVYLGGTMFGARAFAGNFSNDELVKAIKLCHLYGIKVYVTTNILIFERETEQFLNYIEFLHKNNVDAIIIQDIGMLDLVHKTFPNLECHASTQMHIHNLESALLAKELGCKRVVLARETDIDTVKMIKEKTGIDLEIFAHGALCVSYSGECLFSSLIGNRSGNRGSCVGSCRLEYNILNRNKEKLNKSNYPLSMKDLNTLEYIGNLIEANVSSLKIEGRMKSPEYVYTVTRLYREAIDSYYKNGKVSINDKLLKNLQKIFSRGYTKGFLFNENINNIRSDKPNHQGIKIGKVISYKNNYIEIKLDDKVSINSGLRIVGNDDYGFILNQFYINRKLVKSANKGDIISLKVNKKIDVNSIVLLTKDEELNNEINNIIKEKKRKVNIEANLYAKENKPLKLTLFDGINKVEKEGNIVEKSINNPAQENIILERLNKFGNSIYNPNIKVSMDDNIFIPMSELNRMRQELIDELNTLRENYVDPTKVFKKENYSIDVPNFKKEKLRTLKVINNDKKYDNNYYLIYDNKLNSYYERVIVDWNKESVPIGEEILISELGGIYKYRNKKIINTDFSLNVTNSYTVALLHSLGVNRITLSYELTDTQIEKLIDGYKARYNKNPNLELVVNANREVMVLKTNLNKIYGDSLLYLQDKFNNLYDIKEIKNMSYIYDFKRINNFDTKYYDIGINSLRDNI